MATDFAAHAAAPHLAHHTHGHTRSASGGLPVAYPVEYNGQVIDMFKVFPNAVNVSPPSPRDPFAPNCGRPALPSRQIYQPRGTMYIPAVLRPTEKPARNSPPKHIEESPISRRHSMSSTWIEDTVDGAISRVMTGELNDDGHGPVTGPPTRNHWKPDNAVVSCSAPICKKPFSFFLRRHHCRRCGGIFCWEHSGQQARLNQHALFHPDAKKYRVCDRCSGSYEVWQFRRKNRSDSQDSFSPSEPPSFDDSNASSSTLPIPTPNTQLEANPTVVGSMARSCLYDHFSTF